MLKIVGLLPGTEDLRQFELDGNASLAYAYVFALRIVQISTGFLAVGLVRPWGERVFGRRVPLTPVLIFAVLGGLAVIWLFDVSLTTALLTGHRPDDGRVSGAPLIPAVYFARPVASCADPLPRAFDGAATDSRSTRRGRIRTDSGA